MIEDNKTVATMASLFFQQENWDVTYAYDGLEALKIFKANPEEFDIITLDLNLPGMDGIQVGKELRKMSPTVPIIVISARDQEQDQLAGFKIGVDDYVVKPFSNLALVARIKAIYRRVHPEASEETEFNIVTQELKLSSTTREVILYDQKIDNLTPKEFALLETLAKHQKQVFSRDQLLSQVWADNYEVDTRIVDAHIKKLRQKLEKYGPQVIKTVWGVGYKYESS